MPIDPLTVRIYIVDCPGCHGRPSFSFIEIVANTSLTCYLCSQIMNRADFYDKPTAEELLKRLGYSNYIIPNE